MDPVTIKTDVSLELKLTLNEEQARALDALAGYSTQAFLTTFYEKLGRAYLEPHEGGLRSLFGAINRDVPAALKRVDEARKRLANR